MLMTAHAITLAKMMQDEEFFESLRRSFVKKSVKRVAEECQDNPFGINDNFSWRQCERILSAVGIPVTEKHFYTYEQMREWGDYEEVIQQDDEEEFIAEYEVPSTMKFFDNLWKFMISPPKAIPIKDWM